MQSQYEPEIKPPPEHYTVAIICSLGCQLITITCMFDRPFKTPLIDQTNDNNVYTCGCINGHNVVVVSKGLWQTGVVNASVQTGSLKHSFRELKSVIVFGTAGGIPSQPPKLDPTEDIRLGDVVVGWAGPRKKSIVQWDSEVYESGEIKIVSAFDLPSPTFRNALGKLQAVREDSSNTELRKNLDRCLQNKYFPFSQPEPESDILFISTYVHPEGNTSCKECASSKKVDRPERKNPAEVKIHYGTIASGSSVVKSAKMRDRMGKATGALCIEMSAAGVAAWHKTAPLVVKGISDYADSHKTNDMEQWRSYAAATAAAYVRELLYTMDPGFLPQMNYNQPHLSNSETQNCLQDLRSTDPRVDKTRIENTKGGLLSDLHRWILEDDDFKTWRDNKESQLLWIKGDPGKGKTMLLCGIIDELKKSTTNVVSFFFCEAADSRINNATAVLRGLIYLLVKEHDSLVSHVRDHAGEKPLDGENHWWALLNIFDSIIHDPSLQNTYCIIDALDECVTDLRRLLTFIAQNSSASPRVKWIVSSRKWPIIENDLCAAKHKRTLCLESKDGSISAVSRYIKLKVDLLKDMKGLDDKTRQIVQNKLSSNAENTFLWVAMVCRELEKVDRWQFRVDMLNAFPPGLDPIYQRMMEHICNSNKADLCKRILAVILTVYRPITLQELTSFIDMPDISDNHEYLADIIGLCGFFLTLRDPTVYFIHKSVKGFLLEKAMDKIFPSGMKTVHYSIFSRSLQIMSDKLRCHDIYKLKRPGFSIDLVEQPEPGPLAAVRYSCVYWVDHLCECNQSWSSSWSSSWYALRRTQEYKVRSLTPPDPDGYVSSSLGKWCYLSLSRFWIYLWFLISLIKVLWCDLQSVTNTNSNLQDDGSVDKFLRQSYLQWLEALSLLRSLSSNAGRIPGLYAFVHDAKSFVLYNHSVIEKKSLQIYCSALVFAPEKSIVRETFEGYIPRWIQLKPKVQAHWNAARQTLEGHSDCVNSTAFAPDGKLIVSESDDDNTVRLWDVDTGTACQTLEGHSDYGNSTAFSPDDKLTVSGSDDHRIRLWDVDTGATRQTLEGHSDLVKSTAFSLDGKFIVSGSYDDTIRLWDVETGATRQTFGGHSGSIISTVVSPNASNWIVEEAANVLWLPPDYRPNHIAVCDRTIALAQSSGRVLFIRISQEPKILQI
ncbi:hypothetical protein MMC07_007182 [Pseudocyphellaria aurata]|nr:hypothetical protein [Pseudocyphellaria aurata]